MTDLPDQLKLLDGLQLREVVRSVATIRSGAVSIAGPVSADYEKYQVKNHPETVDTAVTVVMGAPFPAELRKKIAFIQTLLRGLLEGHDVTLWAYGGHHVHATVSPLVRTPFDPEIYLIDPEASVRRQELEIERWGPSAAQVEGAIQGTGPFHIAVTPWRLAIGARGEVLLLSVPVGDRDKERFRLLRERLSAIAGGSARDRGSRVHMAIATIEGFHRLTGSQKAELAVSFDTGLAKLSDPGHQLVDRVLLVRYLHRSLSRVVGSREIRLAGA